MTAKEYRGGMLFTELVQMGLLIWWSAITHFSRETVLMVWILDCELSIWLGLFVFRTLRTEKSGEESR